MPATPNNLLQTYKAILQKLPDEKIRIFILLILWMIIQGIAYFHFGIRMAVDSERYIQNANLLVHGNWPEGAETLYFTYGLIIAALQLIGLSATWIVLIQIILSAIALVGIYRIVQRLDNKGLAPFLAGMLYLLWFKFQQWNLIVYTDSLFTSAVIISVWLLLIANSNRSYIVAFVVIILTALIRPPGIGFLIAILIYLLYDRLTFKTGKTWVSVTILVLCFGFSLIGVNAVLRDFVPSFFQSYGHAELIYPGISLGIEPPEHLNFPDAHQEPLLQMLIFILKNPYYMIKISFAKGLLFLGHIKPYYSLYHNLLIGFYLYPIYLLAIVGASVIYKRRLFFFIVIFIGLNILAVSLTSENWDGRFLLPVLPWIFVMASIGITKLFKDKVGIEPVLIGNK